MPAVKYWTQRVDGLTKEYQTRLTEIAAAYRLEVLVPFCTKHKIVFLSGNNDFFFVPCNALEREVNRFIHDVHDGAKQGLKMKAIFEVLNHEVARHVPFGFYMTNVEVSDMPISATQKLALARPVALDDRDPHNPVEFTETPAGERAREQWAERYDELNGAPESDDDR